MAKPTRLLNVAHYSLSLTKWRINAVNLEELVG